MVSSSALDGLYQQLILDHSKKRAGDGVLDHHDAEHFERNPSCGDEITLQLAMEPGTDRVESLGWTGSGCSISMASASVLSELAPGKTIDELVSVIVLTMPNDGSAVVSETEALNLTAYILQQNGMPAGAAPLTKDSAAAMLARLKK